MVALAVGAAAVPSLIAIVVVLRSESRIRELETSLRSGSPTVASAQPGGPAPPAGPAQLPVPPAVSASSGASVPGSLGDGHEVPLDPQGIPVDRIVTYDSFERLWRGAFASQAETQCWRPLEASGHRDLPPMAHFIVTVSAKGEATDVVPDFARPDEATKKLHDCVAKIVRKVRFPEPGKAHSGRVQADRPKR